MIILMLDLVELKDIAFKGFKFLAEVLQSFRTEPIVFHLQFKANNTQSRKHTILASFNKRASNRKNLQNKGNPPSESSREHLAQTNL